MDRCGNFFYMDAPGFKSMGSKSRSMSEIPSVNAVESSGVRNRRYSCAVTSGDFNVTSHEYVSEHKRCKSAEPRLIQETKISDDVQTDIDTSSVGTYLVVPRQGQTLKTTPDDKKSPSFVFSHNQKKLSLGEIFPSLLLSRDSLSETQVDVQSLATSNTTQKPDHSKFQVLESVLQQRSTPGVRDGLITLQQTSSVDKIADIDCSSGAEVTPQQFASSDDSLDSASNEHLFRVHEEHVSQQRMVSVEREQCITKEKAAMSVVQGCKVSSRHHRAVTVSRSQTWSFRDKTKSDQLLREAETVKTQDSKLGDSSEQLLDEMPACDLGLTMNSCSTSYQSKTLPHSHVQSSQTVRPLQRSLEEPPVSIAVQSCLLRDYDKDKDWSIVPWTDEPGNQ